MFGMAEETLDGAEIDGSSVVEAAQSPSLGGGLRLIVVRDAHAMKNPEQIRSFWASRKRRKIWRLFAFFLSKDFDQRKKISKLLLEKAAVVPCEDVPENEREAWIQYLAKRRGVISRPNSPCS